MKISVITVCYNSEETIADTMESVNRQSYGDLEHIIVDGASEDGTLDLVRQNGKRISTIISEPDEGIYDAMNKGIGVSTGDVIGFLNSDDRYQHQNVLKRYAEEFQDRSVDACYADLVYTEADDDSSVIRYWKSRDYEEGACSRGWMPAHPTFYARREVYEEFGLYDTSYDIQSDFEMMLRLLDVKMINTSYIPEVMVRMRTGGQSNLNIRNVIKGNREALAACRKHGYPAGLIFVLRKLAMKIPQFLNSPD